MQLPQAEYRPARFRRPWIVTLTYEVDSDYASSPKDAIVAAMAGAGTILGAEAERAGL